MKLKHWTFISALIAAIVGSLFLSIAFQHNPQGEFVNNENGEIAMMHSAELFAAWFMPVFLLLELPALLIMLIKRLGRP